MRLGVLLGFGVVAAVVVGCGASGGSGEPFGGDGGTACPASMPSGACAAEGQSCDYGCGTGGPGTATCTSGTWAVSRSNIACNVQQADGGDAGPPPADAPFACGTQTCGVNQYCVEPCCGGAAPQCLAPDDAGACPAGFHTGFCPGGGGGNGCVQDACTPPPPFCVDSPTDSRAGGCQSYGSGRTLTCLCA